MNEFVIDESSLQELQFSFLLEGLKLQTFSPEGRDAFDSYQFFTDNSKLEYQRDFIAELMSIFAVKNCMVASVPEISDFIERMLKDGLHLEGEQIWKVQEYITVTANLKALFEDEEIETPLLDEILDRIIDMSTLTNVITEYLVSPGIIREDHPRIVKKMQAVRQAKSTRSSLVQNYINSGADTLQSNQAAMRENRLVLPIKSKDKQRYPGFVHTSSQTGNTLFIEPYDLIERNNDVSIAEQELIIEIERIYREISDLIRDHHEDIMILRRVTEEFDIHYAKARFSRKNNFTRPLTSNRSIDLKGIRHPILQEKAIPISIKVDEDTRCIVMSGPNAGGKTVTLKTIGFMALMNQMGMYLPADDGSALPIFSSVYTDIGDEQSIELDLSTFSGHLKRIGDIMRHEDEDSLIIFDELGSGTDPIEGAALAQAIIEFSYERSGLTLVTSHHASLKQFAYAHENVMNASMEFSESAKSPTYRVILGEPGDSHAIETAQRMEFPKTIIDRAKDIVGKEVIEVSAIMKSLKTREEELNGRESHIAKREKTLRTQVRDSDLFNLKLRQKEMIQKRTDVTQLQKYIKESRSLLETTIRELREEELTKERVAKARERIEALERRSTEDMKSLRSEEESFIDPVEPQDDTSYRIGDRIRVKSSGTTGKIIREGKRREWNVELDNGLRLTLSESNFRKEMVTSKDNKVSWHTRVNYTLEGSKGSSATSVDVRGMTLSESLEKIERFIDSAIISDLHELSIIHGKGEGVLQRGIHSSLSQMPQVRDFFFAKPEDGGYGKTYIILI